VERFFRLLTDEALRRGSHTGVSQLRAAIVAFVDVHNERGTPFKWIKTADEILDRMRASDVAWSRSRLNARRFLEITDPGD
jgi:hypothetical protein